MKRQRHNINRKLVVRNGALNSLNHTTGGMIIVVNGSASAYDYQGMSNLAAAGSKAQPSTLINIQHRSCVGGLTPFMTAQSSSSPPPRHELPKTSVLSTFRDVSIINGAMNDLQNTTGGSIALINKCCTHGAGKQICIDTIEECS